MVAPATLVLGLYAGPAPSRADGSCHSWRLPRLLPHTPPILHRNFGSSSSSKLNLLCKNPSLSIPKAVAVDSDQLGSPQPAEKETLKRYYFLVANAKFMLDEEEHFQELMFEKLRNYEERSKEQDFWLVIEPKFLEKFPNVTKRLKRPAVALVSTDANWITFMKLRLDRVLAESFESNSFEEALASNPVELRFEKPDKWVAPYPKYEFGWWETFLPSVASKTDV